MSMRTKHATTSLLICLVLLLSACRKSDDFKPSKLIGPLYSGRSLAAVERDLDLKPGDWKVLEDVRPLSSDKRPPFRIFTISKPQPMYSIPGELVMTFYNDRLMTTQFFPQDLDRFKAAMQKEDGIALSSDNDAKIAPSTRVWVGKNSDGATYVGFIDKVLQAQHDAWLKQYGS